MKPICFLLLKLSLVGLMGCSQYRIRPVVVDLPGGDPQIDLRVGLVVPEELQSVNFERSLFVDIRYAFLFEGHFADNCLAVTQKLFRECIRGKSRQDLSAHSVDVYLEPSLVRMDRTIGAPFGDCVLWGLFRWTLVDPQGNVIWLETIRAAVKEEMGISFTRHMHGMRQGRKLVVELFSKSYEEMKASPEIRAFAEAVSASRNAKNDDRSREEMPSTLRSFAAQKPAMRDPNRGHHCSQISVEE